MKGSPRKTVTAVVAVCTDGLVRVLAGEEPEERLLRQAGGPVSHVGLEADSTVDAEFVAMRRPAQLNTRGRRREHQQTAHKQQTYVQ